MTLLAVVMGAPDAKVRFKDAAALLDYGFGKCNLYLDENRKNPDPVPIKGGVKAEVACRYTGEFRYLDTEGKNLSQIEKKIVCTGKKDFIFTDHRMLHWTAFVCYNRIIDKTGGQMFETDSGKKCLMPPTAEKMQECLPG